MTDSTNPQVEIMGEWTALPADHPPTNRMVLDANQLSAHWRRCSLTSDFWARYTALFIPSEAPADMLPREAMESVLSYLLNELFENCAKFSAGPVLNVEYQSWIWPREMIIQLTNHIRPETRPPFQAFIREILDGDPDELYFQKLEENVALELDGSGLGYLTLIKDYGIRFGFRFRPIDPESIAVDVQARVNMEKDD